MLKNKIFQTITGNAFNSLLGFLCLMIVQKTGTHDTTEAYIKLTNYALILLPFIEIGKSTYIAASPSVSEKTIKIQSILTSIILICGVIVVHRTSLKIEIIVISLGIYISKIASAKFQRNGSWSLFNLTNLISNFTKLIAILGGLLIGVQQYYIQIVVGAGFASALITYTLGQTQKLRYSRTKNIDWSFLSHYGIGCVIAIAMRLDLIIVDILLKTDDFTAYGLMFQISMFIPIITNALMSVYLVDGTKKDRIVHPMTFIMFLAVAAVPLYFTSKFLALHLFSITNQEYVVAGLFIMLSGLGGLYYTRHEAAIYKHNPSAIFKLKILQMLIIAMSYPTIIVTEVNTVIIPALFVFLSRVYAWSVIYVNNKSS